MADEEIRDISQNGDIIDTEEGFEPSQSIRAAEKYAKDVLGIPGCSYKGVDLTVANEWNKGLHDTFRRSPMLKDNFKFVGESHERNKAIRPVMKQHYLDSLIKANPRHSKEALEPYAEAETKRFMRRMSVGKNTIAQSFAPSNEFLKEFGGITINREVCKDAKELIKRLNADVSAKFHPEGCNTIKSVLDHEVGHQLDSLLELSKDKEIQKLFDRFSQNEMTEALSEYAWNNSNPNRYSEMVAEAWSEYCNNSHPRKIARSVGKIIEEKYKKLKGGNTR